MAGKIFINYRRGDSAPHALAVAGYLEDKFGKSNIFIDIDRLLPGQEFETVLKDKLGQCEVMLAIIGPNWVDARDEKTGSRRLADPEDWVRAEIEGALARNIRVIPILVAGAKLPSESDLPKSLQPLLKRQAVTLTTNGFRYEMAGLAGDLAEPAEPRRWDRIAVFAGAALALSLGSYLWWLTREAADPALSVEPGSGKTFQDRLADGKPCPRCPEMVVVPCGEFTMGSPATEEGHSDKEHEETQVSVKIDQPFAVGKFAVTFDQWDACADKGCNNRPDNRWGSGNLPVINVSWDDAKAYAEWLSQKTGKTYRLLSEAEREYVTRAGETAPFWWGSSSISSNQANYDGNYSYAGGPKGEYRGRTVPVNTFAANRWGLFNVHGNVWEWTEDCWNDSNQGNPGDGSARTTSNCREHVVRGGSWASPPGNLRAAYRDHNVNRENKRGFRLARTIPFGGDRAGLAECPR